MPFYISYNRYNKTIKINFDTEWRMHKFESVRLSNRPKLIKFSVLELNKARVKIANSKGLSNLRKKKIKTKIQKDIFGNELEIKIYK